MQTEDITALIRQRAEFESMNQARDAAASVLTVLARCQLGGEALNAAAQLPPGYDELLSGSDQWAEISSVDEFLQAIRQELDLSETAAHTTARAVISSVSDALTDGERGSFVNALPPDLSTYTRWS